MKIEFEVITYSIGDGIRCYVQARHMVPDDKLSPKSFCITQDLLDINGEYKYIYYLTKGYCSTRGFNIVAVSRDEIDDLTEYREEEMFQYSTVFNELDVFLLRKIQHIMQECLHHKRGMVCDVNLN
ncbi:hypothetical protein AAAA58_00300 [Escherichia coli]|uniref:hypothetical protein n=1 Tax=Escherichia coli TaxID=562 RepID=UPI0034D6E0A8